MSLDPKEARREEVRRMLPLMLLSLLSLAVMMTVNVSHGDSLLRALVRINQDLLFGIPVILCIGKIIEREDKKVVLLWLVVSLLSEVILVSSYHRDFEGETIIDSILRTNASLTIGSAPILLFLWGFGKLRDRLSSFSYQWKMIREWWDWLSR